MNHVMVIFIMVIFIMVIFIMILLMVILFMVIIAMVSFVSLWDERTLLLGHVSLFLYQRVQRVEADRDAASRQFGGESSHDGK